MLTWLVAIAARACSAGTHACNDCNQQAADARSDSVLCGWQCSYHTQVSAEVLKHLVTLAKRELDDDVTQAVITIPARFNAQQRAATEVAARLAGIQQVSLLQVCNCICDALGCC